MTQSLEPGRRMRADVVRPFRGPVAGQRVAAEYLRRLVREYPQRRPPWLEDEHAVNWLIRLAEYHRIGGLLGRMVERGRSDEVDRYVEFVTARSMMCRARMAKDLRVADAALSGLPRGVLLLKGFALADLYRQGDRDFRDLDLLVDGRDLADAVDRLQTSGARLLDVNFELLRRIGSGELTLQMPSGTVLDLHWHLLHTRRIRREFRVPVPELMERAVPSGIDGTTLGVLDHCDALWYSAIHACMAGGERMSWFKDMQLLAETGIDWDRRILPWTKRTSTGLPVAITLERARRLVGLSVPHREVDRLEASRTWRVASAALDRLYAPHLSARKRPDRIFYRNTRATGASSARELLVAAKGDLVTTTRGDELHPWRFYKTEDDVNPLRLELDEGRRRDFFADVAEETRRSSAA